MLDILAKDFFQGRGLFDILAKGFFKEERILDLFNVYPLKETFPSSRFPPRTKNIVRLMITFLYNY